MDRGRLAQVLGMLGSAHDGEIVNAARLAVRMLKEAGLTWPQLLDGGQEQLLSRPPASSFKRTTVCNSKSRNCRKSWRDSVARHCQKLGYCQPPPVSRSRKQSSGLRSSTIGSVNSLLI